MNLCQPISLTTAHPNKGCGLRAATETDKEICLFISYVVPVITVLTSCGIIKKITVKIIIFYQAVISFGIVYDHGFIPASCHYFHNVSIYSIWNCIAVYKEVSTRWWEAKVNGRSLYGLIPSSSLRLALIFSGSFLDFSLDYGWKVSFYTGVTSLV